MTTKYTTFYVDTGKVFKTEVYEMHLLAVFDDNDAAEEYVDWLNSGSKMDKEDRND